MCLTRKVGAESNWVVAANDIFLSRIGCDDGLHRFCCPVRTHPVRGNLRTGGGRIRRWPDDRSRTQNECERDNRNDVIHRRILYDSRTYR